MSDYYDENTLMIVHDVLRSSTYVDVAHVTELIGQLQNAGILFRERRPAYDDNGNLIAHAGMTFRQVGWMVNGGTYDGLIIDKDELETIKSKPHGSFSPVYVEVGD